MSAWTRLGAGVWLEVSAETRALLRRARAQLAARDVSAETSERDAAHDRETSSGSGGDRATGLFSSTSRARPAKRAMPACSWRLGATS